MGILSKIKDLLSGKKSSKNTSSVKKASKTSYYGGGGSNGSSSSYKTYAKKYRDDDKEKQRQRLAEQNKQTTAKLAEIAKVSQRTDALSSGKKSLPPEPKALANNGVARAIEKIGKKSQGQKNLDILEARRREARDVRREAQGAYHEATHHRYDVAEKGISKEERRQRIHNIQAAPMGEMMFGREDEAVDVAKTKMKYDKERTSFERGAANTFTLGTVNLAEKRLAQGTRKEAEDIYQANKSRGAETVGSLVGGLAIYGGTAGKYEGIGQQAVGRAATTQLGKKLGAEKLAQVMAGEGAKAALARSLVGDTIQDSTMGLFHTGMEVAARDDLETPGDYLKAIAEGQMYNYGLGLVGNALGHGLPVAGNATLNWWRNFADESRKLRIVPKGVAESYENLLSERKELMDGIFAKNENADPNALRRLQEINSELENIEQAHPEIKEKITSNSVKKATKAAESEAKITEDNVKKPTETAEPEAKITEDNVKKETSRKPTKNEQKRAELQAERDALAERYRLAKENGATPKPELQQMADDMMKLDAMLKDLDGKIKAADARRTAKQTKAESSATVEQAKAEPSATAEPSEAIANENVKRQIEDRLIDIDEELNNLDVSDNASFQRRWRELQDERDELTRQLREPQESARTVEAESPNAEEPGVEANAEADAPKLLTKEQQKAFKKKIKQYEAEVDNLRVKIADATTSEQKKALEQQLKELNKTIKKEYAAVGMKYKPANKNPRIVGNPEEMAYAREERPTLLKRASQIADDVKMRVADSLRPYEEIARTFAKSDPVKMQNMYGDINGYRSADSVATKSIYGEKHLNYMQDAVADSKSLKEIYKDFADNPKAEAAFDTYLLLQHNLARIDEGTPIFDDVPLRNLAKSGGARGNLNDKSVCKKEAKRILKEWREKGFDFEKYAEDVYAYTRIELENLVDSGMVSRETADKWLKDHPFYVPTHREGYAGMSGEIHGKVVGAKGIKRTKGSDRNIQSIRDQLERMTRQNWNDITLNDMLKSTFEDKLSKEALDELDDELESVVANNIHFSKDGDRYFADVRIGGERKRIEVDKSFVDGVEDWGKKGRIGIPFLDTFNDILSKPAHLWKALITEDNPIFLANNFLRDAQEAGINSRQPKEYVEAVPKALDELNNGGKYLDGLMNSGVSQASLFDLDKELLRAAKGESKNLIARGLRKIESANQSVELLPRLTEYIATFEKAGIPIEEADKALRMRAAANAADITVNFGRSGSVGKFLNRGYIPFFNPSVQGWSKFARDFTEQPGAKSYLKFFARLAALGPAATVANNFLYGDNENFQNVSARDKAGYFFVPIPPWEPDTADTFIKIPKSRIGAAVSAPFVNIGNKNKAEFSEIIKIANDQIAPVNPSDNSFGSALINTVSTPEGKTWYGTDIVPESLQSQPKPEQYDVNTSNIGKGIGKASEKVSDALVKIGVEPKTAEKVQISPKKADYLIDQETGIVGDIFLPLTTPSKQGGGTGIKKYGPALLSPLTRPFTLDTTTRNDLSTRFYESLKRAETSNNSYKAGKKEKKEYDRMGAYSEEVSGINRAIKELQGSSKETKLSDVKELQKYRNELMQNALDGKDAPDSTKTLDAVQNYVGTTYAIENFGSSADKQAMKVYGKARYGNLSDEEMEKKINADEGFYKGVRAIGELEDKITAEAGVKSNTKLMKAVALATAGADNDLFGAYECANKGRTESDNKMNRARAYLKSGGSEEEFAQLEKVRKNYGKLTEYDKDAEIDKIDDQLAKGEISIEEYNNRADAINYNANISYIGLATSLAQANAPERGYRLYDIKDRNIQKGINLAAMGFTARDYRDMTKALDTNGNGYPSKAEITAYVANSDIEDKATLFDALYSYQGRNPFGTPTNYTRSQAAEMGRSNGIESISNESGAFSLNPKESSSGSGWHGYSGGYHYYGHGGGGRSKKAKVPAPKKIAKGSLKSGEALVSKSRKSSSRSTVPTLARVEAKIDLPTKKR